MQQGAGTYGIVREADGPTGKVAVKIILKKNVKDNEKMVYDELSLLQRLHHPHIVAFRDWFESRVCSSRNWRRCVGETANVRANYCCVLGSGRTNTTSLPSLLPEESYLIASANTANSQRRMPPRLSARCSMPSATCTTTISSTEVRVIEALV